MVGLPHFEVTVYPCEDGAPGESSGPQVVVAGEVDMATASTLQDALISVLSGNVSQVVVDLSSTEFIDAAGVNALIVSTTAAHRQGVDLVLHQPSSAVCRVLDILELDGQLHVVRHVPGE